MNPTVTTSVGRETGQPSSTQADRRAGIERCAAVERWDRWFLRWTWVGFAGLGASLSVAFREGGWGWVAVALAVHVSIAEFTLRRLTRWSRMSGGLEALNDVLSQIEARDAEREGTGQ